MDCQIHQDGHCKGNRSLGAHALEKFQFQNSLRGLKEKQGLWEIHKLLLLKITIKDGTACGGWFSFLCKVT